MSALGEPEWQAAGLLGGDAREVRDDQVDAAPPSSSGVVRSARCSARPRCRRAERR